jgi:hypothetical protein
VSEQHQGSSYASPFDHASEPEEPPRGTVLAFQRLGHNGLALDYVSVRAGDGLWYTTGKLALQASTWRNLLAALRGEAVGPIRYATAWAELEVPRSAVSARSVGSIDPARVATQVGGIRRADLILDQAEQRDAGPYGGAL